MSRKVSDNRSVSNEPLRCSSAPRSPAHVPTSRSSRTAAGGTTQQRVIATLGRLDQLQQTGQLDALLVSGARLAQSVLLLWLTPKGNSPPSPPDASDPP